METSREIAEDFLASWEMVGRKRLDPTERKSRRTVAVAAVAVVVVAVAAGVRLFAPRKTFCKDPSFCIRLPLDCISREPWAR